MLQLEQPISLLVAFGTSVVQSYKGSLPPSKTNTTKKGVGSSQHQFPLLLAFMLCHNPKQLTDAFISYSSREIGGSGLGGMGVQRQEAEGSHHDGKQETELAPNVLQQGFLSYKFHSPPQTAIPVGEQILSPVPLKDISHPKHLNRFS